MRNSVGQRGGATVGDRPQGRPPLQVWIWQHEIVSEGIDILPSPCSADGQAVCVDQKFQEPNIMLSIVRSSCSIMLC